jgi:hypothetical protein
MGMSIWKIIGSPVKHLTYVYEQEKKLKAEKLKPKPSVVGDIRDGVYFFDMAKALNRNNSFTSKQLLLPFLKRTAFQRLEIICEHIPLWFEKEFHSLKLKFEIKNSTDGLCHAIITHN